MAVAVDRITRVIVTRANDIVIDREGFVGTAGGRRVVVDGRARVKPVFVRSRTVKPARTLPR